MKESPKTNIQEEMMAIYERKLSRWPVPVESLYLKTQYGASHVDYGGK